MAIQDFFQRFPILGNQPAPTDENIGTTAPGPVDVQDEPPPRVHQVPLGASGRANFYGLPENDELNRQLIGPEGLRRFDEMYRTDPHIRRLILMAWAPIAAGTWGLDPYGGDEATDQDRQVAESIWWALTKYMSPNIFEHLSSAGPIMLRSGFLPFEQVWGTCEYQGKQLQAPRKLDLRLPRSIWKWYQDAYGELTHIGQILPNRADVIIPASELVYYRLAPEGDNWQGTSLLRHAYKPWYLKDKLERIAAIGEERKAVGVPIVYPPQNADPQVKAQVEAVLANLHTSEAAYAMMPGPKAGTLGSSSVGSDEWLIDVIQFDSSSGSSIFSLLEYFQTSISSSFAQDFLELGHHQVGARATAEVQEDPYLAAEDALVAGTVLPPLQRLIDRMTYVNWGDKVQGSPVLTVSLSETASLSEIAGYVMNLVSAQALTPDPDLEDYLREHADLPPANKVWRDARSKATLQGYELAGQPQPPPDPNAPQDPNQPPPRGFPPQKPPPGKPPANPKTPASAGKQLAQPTAKWFERLLSHDQLKQAFDGCRDHIQQSCGPQTLKLARDLTGRSLENGDIRAPGSTQQDLADALTEHYQQMYALGHQTVTDELAQQRAKLGRKLDAPTDAASGAAGSRLARARQRGEHSAQNIAGKIGEVLGRQQIGGVHARTSVQTLAEQAATGQLRIEALTNTAAMVNDGRADSALATPDVIGGYYTSVLDESTCDECESADDGALLSPEDAVALGPPNPLCAGGDRCRCAIVWVLSDDAAALG